ncbi:MAG: ABC transporter ATP-binding protein [Thermodesulfovibrio sp.]|nr:ABC transporter ATP-binding protein [Thermodesulfovibrio sp.]
MIQLQAIEKYFGEAHVLRGITLEIKKGEFVAITGSSGSGKSTLLNLIGGMDRPDAGKIIVDGSEISAYSDEQLTLHRRQKIGFVFQFFNLLPNISIFDNVRIPLLLNNISSPERAYWCLERVGLAGRDRSYPWQLSGGEQQRVALARALVGDPEILLADEPTGSLDSRTGARILELLEEISAESSGTIILVTHEEYVARHADRTIRISDGVILI